MFTLVVGTKVGVGSPKLNTYFVTTYCFTYLFSYTYMGGITFLS
jgi:hypothetical protein